MNTALNHLLEKVKDVNFTKKERQELLDISNDVFIEIPNKKYGKFIGDLLSTDNMRSITNGMGSHPEIADDRMINIKSSEPEGVFKTPGFGNSKYKADFYSRTHSLHYILDLQKDIRDMVRDGALVITVQTPGNWSYRLQNKRLQLYETKLNMSDAENFCVTRGGHLASIVSLKEQLEVKQLAQGRWVWLGGRREKDSKNWQWLDGRAWEYQRWSTRPSSALCVKLTQNGLWIKTKCSLRNFFICSIPLKRMSGDSTIVLRRPFLHYPTLRFWSNQTQSSKKSDLDLKLTWHIENGSLPDVREFVSRNIPGRVSTPGVGSLAPPVYYKERHEYTAVIELPHNITDVIGDGALVVDVDVKDPDNLSESGVELLTTSPRLEINSVRMNWTSAEAFCVDKGGHLASVSSRHHWYKIWSLLSLQFIDTLAVATNDKIWLGGTDLEREGNWTWIDGSRWSEEHWHSETDQPDGGKSENCLATDDAGRSWSDEHCDAMHFSVCSLPTKVSIKSDSQLVFTSENISVPALQFTWATKPPNQAEDVTPEEQREANPRVVGGFTLKWKLQGSNMKSEEDNFTESGSEWKIKHKADRSMLIITNLIRQSKIKGVKGRTVWDVLLKYRWEGQIMKVSFLDESQIADVIFKTGQELKIEYDWNIRINEADEELIKELFSVVFLCSNHLVEAAKLSVFYTNLLWHQTGGGQPADQSFIPVKHRTFSFNLRTVVASTFHNIQPRAGDKIKDFTAINMWYERLDKRYNFSLGPNILPMLKSDSLTQLATLDPPYLDNYKAAIKKHQYDNMSSLFGKDSL